jgi:hypothetical protein
LYSYSPNRIAINRYKTEVKWSIIFVVVTSVRLIMCFLGVKKSPPFEGGDLGVVETGLLSCIKLENLMATTPVRLAKK